MRSLRVPDGGIDLHKSDPGRTPGFRGGKRAAQKEQDKLADRLADLQEMLYAEGRTGGKRSLLLVLQGLDTSGKSGTVKHVIGQVDPQGVEITGFKAPTPEERQHPFLWRIKKHLPPPGMIGVFDRSHYEDIVAVRVRGLAPRSVWSRRYDTINRFERDVVDSGTTVVKVFLHVSREHWRDHQLGRLENPAKHWKFNPGDVDDAGLWDDFLTAYSDVFARCNSDHAPWYVVPADHRWYRDYAVTKIVLAHLEGMDLSWPEGDFDVTEQRERVLSVVPQTS